jgi:hypothetical protein
MAIAGKGDDGNRNRPGSRHKVPRGSSCENSASYPARVKNSPLGELELEARVGGARLFVGSLVEGLEFAEASRG